MGAPKWNLKDISKQTISKHIIETVSTARTMSLWWLRHGKRRRQSGRRWELFVDSETPNPACLGLATDDVLLPEASIH